MMREVSGSVSLEYYDVTFSPGDVDYSKQPDPQSIPAGGERKRGAFHASSW